MNVKAIDEKLYTLGICKELLTELTSIIKVIKARKETCTDCHRLPRLAVTHIVIQLFQRCFSAMARKLTGKRSKTFVG